MRKTQSDKRRKAPPKNKPLPTAPSRRLPPGPGQKPRAHTFNGPTPPQPQTSTTSNGAFTYTTTTYYTTTQHPWSSSAQPSSPKQLQQSNTNKKPTTTVIYYNNNGQQNPPPNMTVSSNNNHHNDDQNGRFNGYTVTYYSTGSGGGKQWTSQPFQTAQTLSPKASKHKARSSYHKAMPLAPTITNSDINYSFGDAVDLNDNRQGTIRFIGEIAAELQGAIWYGVELKIPKGDNNGSLKGIQYFKCEANYGTFVQKDKIRWLTTSAQEDEEEEEEEIDLDAPDRFHINQIVKIKGKRGKAQIRFIGLYDDALRYGVELLDDMGKHSGVIDGKFYFTCGVFRGVFVSEPDIIYFDVHDEEKENMHNRSHHRLFNNNLPDFAGRTGDDSDSDDSIYSDSAESVSSLNTVGTVDDAVFERLQLNEDEKEMAFTNILNKFKNVERAQPRPSKLNMTINAQQLMNPGSSSPLGLLPQLQEQNDSNHLQGTSALSLTLSDTSPIIDKTGLLFDDEQLPNTETVAHPHPQPNANATQQDSPHASAYDMDDGYDDVGAIVDDDGTPGDAMDDTPITPVPEMQTSSNSVNIVVTALPQTGNDHSNASQESHQSDIQQATATDSEHGAEPDAEPQTQPDALPTDQVQADEQQTDEHRPEKPGLIETDNEHEEEKKQDNKRDSNALQTPPLFRSMEPHHGKMMSNLLSPIGSEVIRHSPVNSEYFDNEEVDVVFNAEDSHLKEMPDSPYDVNTTQREFANTAQVIQLGCNNPHKLFKLLKGITMKLFQESMKYRILDATSKRIQVKLLNYDGVEEYLNHLGFRSKDDGDKLECPLDQPPLSVLDASMNVCNDFISKTGRKRAVIDMIKKFNPSSLEQTIKGTEFDPDSDKHKLLRIPPSPIDEADNEAKSETPIVSAVTIKITKPQTETTDTTQTETATPADETEEPLPEQLALQNHMSQEQMEEQEMIDTIFEPRVDEASAAAETEEEEEVDDDLEGNNDTFKLSDIIASITHANNSDNSARQIILLCFPTVTDGAQLFACLDRRFFSSDSWHIQTKIISFIQIWMRQYWQEDWASNAIQLNVLEDWLKKIEQHYGNGNEDEWRKSKYKKLADMLVKTIEFQRATARSQSISVRNPHEAQMERVNQENKELEPQKFDQKFDFFRLNNTKVARQLTNMDMTYFGAIKPRECLGQAWKKKNKYEIATNICALIDHFNRVARWVQLRVLLANDAKKRGRVIKKFIKICEQLFILRNFQSLYAIYGALYSSAVIRLKKAWHYVPTKHLAKFEEFKVIFATKRNMANLRKLHRETYPPMIPYTGIYLQDLFSIEEGNKKTKTDGSVNFARLLRLSTVIDSILLLQRTTYKINPDKGLQTLLRSEFQTNQNVSEEKLWQISDKIHKTDNKKSNFIPIFGAR